MTTTVSVGGGEGKVDTILAKIRGKSLIGHTIAVVWSSVWMPR